LKIPRLHTHEDWINLAQWDDNMRGAWEHYDQFAGMIGSGAAAVLALVYVRGSTEFLPELVKLLMIFTVGLTVWSAAIRRLSDYYAKVYLCFSALIPFGLGLLILVFL
jgi:hypothetical protein